MSRGRNTVGVALRGLTLIEILMVMAFLMILSAIAIPQYMRFRHMQRARNCYTATKTLVDAQIMYFKDHRTYAPALANLTQETLVNANASASYFNRDRLLDNVGSGSAGACVSVTFGAATVNSWSASTVPKGKYGSSGCTFLLNAVDHKVTWSIVNCAGPDPLVVTDFKELL